MSRLFALLMLEFSIPFESINIEFEFSVPFESISILVGLLRIWLF